MISITRTHWRWLKVPISLKLGDRSDETETRTGDDFGFPISELCGREGVERVIIGHTDGTYTEYVMNVADEEHELEDLGYGGEPCGNDDGPTCGHAPSIDPDHCVRMTCPNYQDPGENGVELEDYDEYLGGPACGHAASVHSSDTCNDPNCHNYHGI